MTSQDLEAFTRLMATLGAVFGGENNPVKTEAYFQVLNEYEIEYVRAAVTDCLRECEFFPKPVELRERASAHRGRDRREQAIQQGYSRPALTESRALTPEEALEFVREVKKRLNAPPEA